MTRTESEWKGLHTSAQWLSPLCSQQYKAMKHSISGNYMAAMLNYSSKHYSIFNIMQSNRQIQKTACRLGTYIILYFH